MYTDRIRAEQVRSIYRNTTPGISATLIAVWVLSCVLVYIGAADMRRTAVFLGFMTLQTLLRLWVHRRYALADDKDTAWRRWVQWFMAGVIVGGLTIGTGAIWITSSARIDLQLVALLLIFAISAGAVSAFSAFLPAFCVFFTAISIVPVGWLLTRDSLLHVAMGGLYLLWAAAVTEQARRSSQAFAESVRLRFENLDLIEDLQREKAAADQANAAKSRFLAAASHDLRQPVHALSLFVAALRSRPMDQETRELLDHVDGSVHAMGRLFGGLLDISRLDAGVVEINRTAFAIGPMLERIGHDYTAQAVAKGLRLRIRNSSAIVTTDALLVERILRNLLDNAITYTSRGAILVGCRRRGERLDVQVWDSGPGIPPQEQQLVFQEFYQLGNPERDRTKGVGLGLAIVKRLTTLLGHSLQLRSTADRGSCFAIELPLAASGALSTAATGELPMLNLAGSGLILVIDDEAAIQLAMKSLLRSWGYDVIVSGTGNEMLERIAARNEVPKLIICDYRLREHENGIDVIERLRSEYNDEIPGMLITGDTAPDRLREAQDSGFLLLHKPVPNSRLRAAITHLIEEHADAEMSG
ncbi:MAG TPA: hybrid sensor histidine kinase/response regulator [Povalibacter sp.]|nr:hybrid sensor histidine kinase/response regulator [Povalibacter sp.]